MKVNHLKKIDNSLYLVPDNYIPILINKNLFKNYKLGVKKLNNINYSLYVINSFKNNSIKKSPNAFILFRNENFENVKLKNPNNSSREISIIIGKMWKQLSMQCKIPYQMKAKEMKENNFNNKYMYNKILHNTKYNKYFMHKEKTNNIKKLLSLI